MKLVIIIMFVMLALSCIGILIGANFDNSIDNLEGRSSGVLFDYKKSNRKEVGNGNKVETSEDHKR